MSPVKWGTNKPRNAELQAHALADVEWEMEDKYAVFAAVCGLLRRKFRDEVAAGRLQARMALDEADHQAIYEALGLGSSAIGMRDIDGLVLGGLPIRYLLYNFFYDSNAG